MTKRRKQPPRGVSGEREKPPRKRTRFSYGDPVHGAGGRGNFGLTEPEKPKPPPEPLSAPDEALPVPGAAYAPGSPFTPEAGAAVTALLSQGHSQEVAADSVGRKAVTIRRWRRLGERDLEAGLDTPLARFAQDFTRAKGQADAQLEANAIEHSRVHWKPALELLARRRPDLYSHKATPQLLRLLVERILDTVQERATPEEFAAFCEYLDPDTISIEGIA